MPADWGEDAAFALLLVSAGGFADLVVALLIVIL